MEKNKLKQIIILRLKKNPTFQLVNSIKWHTRKSVHLTISVILKSINSQKHILTEVVEIYNETSGKSFPVCFCYHRRDFLITDLIWHISRNNFIVLFLIKGIYLMNLLLPWSPLCLAFLWNPYHPYVHHRFKGQPKW